MKYFRTAIFRCLTGLFIILSLLSSPALAVNSEDSQVFIAGFNAYQKKDYKSAIEKMKSVLDKYPDTPLRDMAIFWLARASYKAGYERDAAKYMSQFFKEYPDSPLKGTIEDELLNLVARYEKGEPIPVAAARPAAEVAVAEPTPAKKALAEKTAAAKQAAEKTAQEKAEAERLAAEKAVSDRAIAEKMAAEKAAAERAAAEKAAAEKLAAEKAEKEKAAAERLAAEKSAREKAEADRLAAEKAALDKAEAERLVAQKAAAERAAAEKTAAETAAAERAVAERIAAEKAAAEKLAVERAATERATVEKAAAEKLAAEKAATEQAETARLAAEKIARERAEAERLAAEKAAQARVEADRLAAQKSADEKAAAERVASEKLAQSRAEAERLAAQKAAAEKAAAEMQAAEKAVLAKAEAERLAADRVAKERAEAERAATQKAAAEQAAVARKAEEEGKAARSVALREKAIAEYKSLIDRFPGTRAAATAAAKLKELGIPYAAAPGKAAVAVVAPVQQEKNAQVLTFEVGQYADAELTILPAGQSSEVGKRHEIPFEIVNKGNGDDSFYLESGFPVEFGAQFASAGKREIPISLTPSLAPGEKFRGVLSIAIPREYIDGQKIAYPVKVASRLDRDASQARDIFFVASAPLLRAVVKSDKGQILPGERTTYRIALLNVGTAMAQGVTLRLNYPPQYEPVGFAEAGLKQEMKAALVLDGIRLNSGESRDIDVTFQLKEEAIAQQELFLRADVVNTELQTKDSFLSAAAFVKAVSGVAVRAKSEKIVAIPGQTISIPLVVTNTGNVREDYLIKPTMPGNLTYRFYQDLNRDGIRQANEPIINHVGPLAPKEESYVILELTTPVTENDGTGATVAMLLEPESDKARSAGINLRLLYSRPVVDLVMAGKGGKLKPGEVFSFELNFTNRGSSMAKGVELQSFLPGDLELVSSDPYFSKGKDGDYLWKFDELGAGEKRTIKVTFKVRTGTAVGTSIQVRNVLKYQDQLGNRY